MYREKLRSRRGCRRCRERRVKCDETHPVCQNCHRLGFLCAWFPRGEDQSRKVNEPCESGVDKLDYAGVVTRRPLTRMQIPQMLNAYQPFRSQTQFMLTMESVPLIKKLIRSKAAPNLSNLSIMITLAIEQEWLRDALAAYGSLLLSRRTERQPKEAYELYSQGCVSLRHRLNNYHLTPPTDFATLIATVFLGLFENTTCEHPRATLIHFTAAAQIFNIVCSRAIPEEFRPFLMFAGELIIFSLATACLLDSGMDAILRTIDMHYIRYAWSWTSEHIEHPYQLSPLMGGKHELYILMIEIVVFSHDQQSQSTRCTRANDWLMTLELLEVGCTHYYQGLPTNEAQLQFGLDQVIIRSLRIILRKIQLNSIDAASELIREEVSAVVELLQRFDFSGRDGAAITWSLVIILCATVDEQVESFLEEKIVSASLHYLSPGQLKWQYSTIQRIRSCKADAAKHGLQDSLDLLTHPEGILGPS